MSAAAMFVVFGILALVLVGLFSMIWLKDRDRSEEEAHDSDRVVGPEQGPPPSG